MRRTVRYQPPPGAALIVAVIALVVAVVGTATGLPGKHTVKKDDYAKKSIPASAFKSGSIPERAFKSSSIPEGAFKSASIPEKAFENASIPAGAFKDGSVALKVLGSDAKSAFLGSNIIVRTDQFTETNGSAGTGTSRKCNDGETPIGGGFFQSIGGTDQNQSINASLPRLDNAMLNQTPNGGPIERWGVNGINETGGEISLTDFILCSVNVK
jgi:hypothetical protein